MCVAPLPTMAPACGGSDTNDVVVEFGEASTDPYWEAAV